MSDQSKELQALLSQEKRNLTMYGERRIQELKKKDTSTIEKNHDHAAGKRGV